MCLRHGHVSAAKNCGSLTIAFAMPLSARPIGLLPCSAPSPSLPPNFRGVRPPSARATPSVQGDSGAAAAPLEAATATSAAATAAENERTLAAAEAEDAEEAAVDAEEAAEAGVVARRIQHVSSQHLHVAR